MLYDHQGNRKYLTSEERRAFIAATKGADPSIATFCLALAYTGARISEILDISPRCIDFGIKAIVIRCLKRRRDGIFRTVPVPDSLLEQLESVYGIKRLQDDPVLSNKRIWPWCRTTAWGHVKAIMFGAKVKGPWAMPKGLRHGLCVEGTADAGIPLNIMQRWLGHARIETTAIYANALGREERKLARRIWE